MAEVAVRGADARPESGTFHVILIKPTHYDDDGYPIQFRKGAMPSNTLACLLALAEDARERRVLGPSVDIRVHAMDETCQRIDTAKIVNAMKQAGARALIGLVGVQSNQFYRAVDLARAFIAGGLPVCMGGFHVSGSIAMLPEIPPEIRAAQEMGISIFAGEAENQRLDRLFRDAWNGTLKPLYNYMNDLPGLEGEPVPFLRPDNVARVTGDFSCFDLGRGCPFQCSFCTIINVQGRKPRNRSADDLERIIRTNYPAGIKRYLITDDNFARNRQWEAMFDRIIALRKEGFDLHLTLQVDTQCHRIPNFIEKAAAAGTTDVFIGLENINPDNLIAAKKRQNKITEYRALLQKWHDHGVITMAGYILGFPADTRESILRDIEILKRELPVDILEFFILTPLPGSEDHKILWEKGVWMDSDLNKYDTNHRVSHHPKMSDAEWEQVYREAWGAYYTPGHIRTIVRRAAATEKIALNRLCAKIIIYSSSVPIEGVHPLEAGASRVIVREDRRYGMPLEDPILFGARMQEMTTRKGLQYHEANERLRAIVAEVLRSPDRLTYRDLATTPQNEDEFDRLELYHATSGGEAALARKRRADAIRAQVNEAHPPA